MSYSQAYATKETKQKDELHVKVFSQFQTYYDDYASSLSAANKTGPFDILKGHANFIALLKKGDLTVRDLNGQEQTLSVERGIVRVNNDQAEVFLDV